MLNFFFFGVYVALLNIVVLYVVGLIIIPITFLKVYN